MDDPQPSSIRLTEHDETSGNLLTICPFKLVAIGYRTTGNKRSE